MIKKLLTAALATCLLGAAPQLQSAGYALPALAAGTGLLTGLDAGAFSYKKNAYPTYSRYAPLAALYGTAAAACFSKGITQFLPDNSFGTALKIAGGAALTVSTAYLGFKLTRQKHNLEVAQKIDYLTKRENSIIDLILSVMPMMENFIKTPENSRVNKELITYFYNKLQCIMPDLENFKNALENSSLVTFQNTPLNPVNQPYKNNLINGFNLQANAEFRLYGHTNSFKNKKDFNLILNEYTHNNTISNELLKKIKSCIDESTQQTPSIQSTEATFNPLDYKSILSLIGDKLAQEIPCIAFTQAELDSLTDQNTAYLRRYQSIFGVMLLIASRLDEYIRNQDTFIRQYQKQEPIISSPLQYSISIAIPSLCAAGYNYDMPIFRNAFLCAGVGSMIPALTGELYRKLDPSRTFIRKTLKTTSISAGAGFLMYAFGELCLHTIGDSTPAKRRACLALPILLGAYTSKHIFNFASDPALELSNVPVVQPEEENLAQLQQNAQQLALGQPEPVQPNIGAADANEPEFDEDDAVF